MIGQMRKIVPAINELKQSEQENYLGFPSIAPLFSPARVYD